VAVPSRVSILSPQTKLVGEIVSNDMLVIAGQINGDVRGKKVVIKDKGCVVGNIICSSLVIEAGGLFDGKASMNTPPPGENSGQEQD